jgi:antitoxin VbhA-like protein
LTTIGTMPLAEAERAVRAQRVAAAIHNGAMEGAVVTPATRADAADYVAGRIDADELVARTRTRYGLG